MKVDDLRESVLKLTDRPWRPGTVETSHVFVPELHGLAGVSGERVMLRMNINGHYAETAAQNGRAVTALVNHGPELLALAKAAELLVTAEDEHASHLAALALVEALQELEAVEAP